MLSSKSLSSAEVCLLEGSDSLSSSSCRYLERLHFQQIANREGHAPTTELFFEHRQLAARPLKHPTNLSSNSCCLVSLLPWIFPGC